MLLFVSAHSKFSFRGTRLVLGFFRFAVGLGGLLLEDFEEEHDVFNIPCCFHELIKFAVNSCGGGGTLPFPLFLFVFCVNTG